MKNYPNDKTPGVFICEGDWQRPNRKTQDFSTPAGAGSQPRAFPVPAPPPAQGVLQLIAGSGISLSPAGGTGIVTVSATGGGGGGGGYWGLNSFGISPTDLNYKVGIGTSSPTTRFFVEQNPIDPTYWDFLAGTGSSFPGTSTSSFAFFASAYDSTGNLYVTGVDATANTPFIFKLDPTGVIVWQKFFTSSNPGQTVTTYGRNIAVDNSASYLYVVFQESLNWNDFVGFTIVKLDFSGNIIWQKLFNSLAVENCFGLSASGGDLYISGLTEYSPTGELYLAKLDSLGNWVWGKSIAASTYNRQAGPTAVDSTGNVIVVGGFSAPVLFKFDPLGNLIWSKFISGNYGVDSYAWLAGVGVDSNDNIYVCGGNGSGARFLVSLDSSGNYRWGTSEDNMVGGNRSYESLTINANDQIIVQAPRPYGSTNQGVLCFDTAGICVWAYEFSIPGTNFKSAYEYRQQPSISSYGDYVALNGYSQSAWQNDPTNSAAVVVQFPSSGAELTGGYVQLTPLTITQSSITLSSFTTPFTVNSYAPVSSAGPWGDGTSPASLETEVYLYDTITSTLNGLAQADSVRVGEFFVNGLPFGRSSAGLNNNLIVGYGAGAGTGGYCYNNHFLGKFAGENELAGCYNIYMGECAGRGTPGPRSGTVFDQLISSTVLPGPWPAGACLCSYRFNATTTSGAYVEGWLDRRCGSLDYPWQPGRLWGSFIRSSDGPVLAGDQVTISGDQIGGVSGVDDATLTLYSEGTYNESYGTIFIGNCAGSKTYGYNYNNIAIGSYAGQYMGVDNEFNHLYLGTSAGRFAFGGFYNLFIGAYAGESAGGEFSFSNTFIGTLSGQYSQNTYYQTFVGAYSGNAYVYGGGMEGPANTFLGAFSGTAATTSYGNTFAGTYSGYDNTTGSYNTNVGGEAALRLSTGSYNVSLGFSAGSGRWRVYNYNTLHLATGNGNTSIGHQSGSYINDTSCLNTALGYRAGQGHLNYDCPGLSSGCVFKNVSIGAYAGQSAICGTGNFFGGYAAGRYSQQATNTVAIGTYAGCVTQGCQNIFVGAYSGYNNTTGSYNIFLGAYAGADKTTSTANVGIGQGEYNYTIYNFLRISSR